MVEDGWREPLPLALLRAPAAIAAGAFIVGLTTGAVVAPFAAMPSASPITFLLTIAICTPFLLPTAWYRHHRLLWFWMTAAAALATMRAVFMAGFLLPHQPVEAWLLKASMDLLAVAVLWLAAAAVRRCSSVVS